MKQPKRRPRLLIIALGTVLAIGTQAMTVAAHAQSAIGDASRASGMSAAVPVAIIGLSAVTALSTATVLTVKSVDVSAGATVVVVEGVINGVVKTVSFTIDAAAGFAVGAGTVLSAASVAGGVLLHEGSRAVAFIPNQRGQYLLYHERLT